MEELKGLTTFEVGERRKNGKSNIEKNNISKKISSIIFDNVFTLFNIVNVIFAICIICVKSYKNMMFMGIVFWNTFIGVFQEIRAKKIIEKMSILSQKKASVIRNGFETEVNREEVVIDDLLVLRSGDQICADCLMEYGDCFVDESLLTGESDEVKKVKGMQMFAGSFVTEGIAYAKVNRVGKDNYVGKIISKVKYHKGNTSEMMKSIKSIIKFLSICIIPLTILLFWHQLSITEDGIKGAVVNTVAAIIGTMPSGLVLLTTIVMEVAVIRLSKHNTLVQDMYCIETLARVDVICLDKTGTLTEGKMKLLEVDYLGNSENEIMEIMGNYVRALKDKNATSEAMKCFFDEKNSYKCVETIPFSSDKKYSAVAFENVGTCVVGACEFINKKEYLKLSDVFAKYEKKGYRIISMFFADKMLSKDNKNISDLDLQIKALFMLKDNMRENAVETLNYLKRQNVDIKVISGDNPITARNIAMEAGIENAHKYIDCSEIEDSQIEEIVEKYTIFGRTTPIQKSKIIEMLKKKGHTVAMTGDGVNDVIALKEADCGIAMQSGSDSARNIAQIILMDSDFKAVPRIIEEGRKTINNMERSAVLYLTKTIYSFVLAIIFTIISIRYPFYPIQLTLIGALSIGIPSFILAMEPNYARVNGKFIRNVLSRALPGAAITLFSVLISMCIGAMTNATYAEKSTISAYMIAIASMIVLFELCHPFTKIRTIMYIGLALLFVCILGRFKALFNVTELNMEIFIVIIIVGVFTFLLHKILYRITNVIIGRKSKK